MEKITSKNSIRSNRKVLTGQEEKKTESKIKPKQRFSHSTPKNAISLSKKVLDSPTSNDDEIKKKQKKKKKQKIIKKMYRKKIQKKIKKKKKRKKKKKIRLKILIKIIKKKAVKNGEII